MTGMLRQLDRAGVRVCQRWMLLRLAKDMSASPLQRPFKQALKGPPGSVGGASERSDCTVTRLLQKAGHVFNGQPTKVDGKGPTWAAGWGVGAQRAHCSQLVERETNGEGKGNPHLGQWAGRRSAATAPRPAC